MLRVLLCVASLASWTIAQSDERVIAVRSLQPFLPPSLQSSQAMSSALASEDENSAKDATLRGRLDGNADWVAELLTERHSKAIESGGLRLQVDANVRIAFSGTKAAVNACLADIDAMAATLARSIEISAYRLRLPKGVLPLAFLDGQTLQAVLAANPPLWSARAITRPGGSVQLGDVQWTTYVHDVDAEVAKESRIMDPKIKNLFQGTRVNLTVHSLPNDELLLHGSWLSSDNLSLEESSTGKGQATIDQPHNRTAHITFAGRLSSGGGLLTAGRESGPEGMQFLLLVRARYLTPPPPRADNLFIFPASAWRHTTGTAWRLQAGWFASRDADGRHPVVSEMPIMSPRSLASFLAPDHDGLAMMAGSTLIIAGNSAICARAEARLHQLVDAQLHQAELRVHQTAEDGSLRASFVQPVLSGMQARAFLGRERAVIGDHDVEIAEDSAISNPIVFTVRSGLWSRTIGHALGHTWNLEGLWRTAKQRATRTHVQTGKHPMTMQLPDYRTATWSWDGVMPSDREQALGPHFAVHLTAK